uniref:SH2 domain protein n=1 Tax=Mimiviridae sp. ChoanoV1 TaxID=2596887 RepID=A0A5B8IEJ4_9VIRU|nr:SH2 domain protein [Mimiviridae sp. ChoanoV1]
MAKSRKLSNRWRQSRKNNMKRNKRTMSKVSKNNRRRGASAKRTKKNIQRGGLNTLKSRLINFFKNEIEESKKDKVVGFFNTPPDTMYYNMGTATFTAWEKSNKKIIEHLAKCIEESIRAKIFFANLYTKLQQCKGDCNLNQNFDKKYPKILFTINEALRESSSKDTFKRNTDSGWRLGLKPIHLSKFVVRKEGDTLEYHKRGYFFHKKFLKLKNKIKLDHGEINVADTTNTVINKTSKFLQIALDDLKKRDEYTEYELDKITIHKSPTNLPWHKRKLKAKYPGILKWSCCFEAMVDIIQKVYDLTEKGTRDDEIIKSISVIIEGNLKESIPEDYQNDEGTRHLDAVNTLLNILSGLNPLSYLGNIEGWIDEVNKHAIEKGETDLLNKCEVKIDNDKIVKKLNAVMDSIKKYLEDSETAIDKKGLLDSIIDGEKDNEESHTETETPSGFGEVEPTVQIPESDYKELEYFHSDISREEAEKILGKDVEDVGNYLIRFSKSKGGPVLSYVNSDNSIIHRPILKDESGKFKIQKEAKGYESISGLIKEYLQKIPNPTPVAPT